MDHQVVRHTPRQRLKIKIFIILMTCLAGSQIVFLLYKRGIRGLERIDYALIVFLIATVGLVWTIWPSRPKSDKRRLVGSTQVSQDPTYQFTEDQLVEHKRLLVGIDFVAAVKARMNKR